jgi:hypothetical protein
MIEDLNTMMRGIHNINLGMPYLNSSNSDLHYCYQQAAVFNLNKEQLEEAKKSFSYSNQGIIEIANSDALLYVLLSHPDLIVEPETTEDGQQTFNIEFKLDKDNILFGGSLCLVMYDAINKTVVPNFRISFTSTPKPAFHVGQKVAYKLGKDIVIDYVKEIKQSNTCPLNAIGVGQELLQYNSRLINRLEKAAREQIIKHPEYIYTIDSKEVMYVYILSNDVSQYQQYLYAVKD